MLNVRTINQRIALKKTVRSGRAEVKMTIQRNRRFSSSKSVEWLDNGGSFLIGKYKGESAYDISRSDPSYIRWVIETVESINESDRELLSQLLSQRGQ